MVVYWGLCQQSRFFWWFAGHWGGPGHDNVFLESMKSPELVSGIHAFPLNISKYWIGQCKAGTLFAPCEIGLRKEILQNFIVCAFETGQQLYIVWIAKPRYYALLLITTFRWNIADFQGCLVTRCIDIRHGVWSVAHRFCQHLSCKNDVSIY